MKAGTTFPYTTKDPELSAAITALLKTEEIPLEERAAKLSGPAQGILHSIHFP